MSWISILHQRPYAGEYVLVAIRPTKHGIPWEPFLVQVQSDGTFKDKWGFCDTFKMTVDYWMPLPELPHDT